MSSLKGKIIKPSFAYTRLPDDGFLSRVNAVVKGMDGNPAFPNPPVDPKVLSSAAGDYTALIVKALDGSKQAKAERQAKRDDLTLMTRQLAHYVEVACKGDMGTFLSSGFEALAASRSAAQLLAQPTVLKVDQGNSSQLLVSISSVPGARNYDVRYSAAGSPAAPGSWSSITVPSVRQPVALNGLTPGTTYTIQVRAFGTLGHTDWSDAVTRPCF